MVRSDALHSLVAGSETAEDVTATDDDGKFHTQGPYVDELLGNLGANPGV